MCLRCQAVPRRAPDKWREAVGMRDKIIMAACRLCGCTDDVACPGGCWWIEEDLCNRCGEEAKNEIEAR